MVGKIYSYSGIEDSSPSMVMFEFDMMTDWIDGKGIRCLNFFKGDDDINNMVFDKMPFVIYIMENGKTIETIRYKMNDVR